MPYYTKLLLENLSPVFLWKSVKYKLMNQKLAKYTFVDCIINFKRKFLLKVSRMLVYHYATLWQTLSLLQLSFMLFLLFFSKVWWSLPSSEKQVFPLLDVLINEWNPCSYNICLIMSVFIDLLATILIKLTLILPSKYKNFLLRWVFPSCIC